MSLTLEVAGSWQVKESSKKGAATFVVHGAWGYDAQWQMSLSMYDFATAGQGKQFAKARRKHVVDEQNHLLSRSKKNAGSSHLRKFCVTKKSFNVRLTPSVLPYLQSYTHANPWLGSTHWDKG